MLYGNNRSNRQIRSQERSLDQPLTPDDRSSFTACLRRSRAGGDFALRLHTARLVDRAGRRAFAAVTGSSPRQKNGNDSDAKGF
jgi:hypothetical protein